MSLAAVLARHETPGSTAVPLKLAEFSYRAHDLCGSSLPVIETTQSTPYGRDCHGQKRSRLQGRSSARCSLDVTHLGEERRSKDDPRHESEPLWQTGGLLYCRGQETESLHEALSATRFEHVTVSYNDTVEVPFENPLYGLPSGAGVADH